MVSCIRLQTRRYTIRFGELKEDFVKDATVARCANQKIPIPAILEIGEAFGGYYAISERAYGKFLDELDEEGMHKVLPNLFVNLDSVRSLDLSTTTGFGLWNEMGKGEHSNWQKVLLAIGTDQPHKRTYGWRKKLEASTLGSAAFDAAVEALGELVTFCPNERYLIHSDLLNRNVLVQDSSVSALLDWGSSMYGDFLYDIAWLLYWWPWFPAWEAIDILAEVKKHFASIKLELPNLEERLKCYQIHIGLDAQAYNAFTGRWDELAKNTTQTTKLIAS